MFRRPIRSRDTILAAMGHELRRPEAEGREQKAVSHKTFDCLLLSAFFFGGIHAAIPLTTAFVVYEREAIMKRVPTLVSA